MTPDPSPALLPCPFCDECRRSCIRIHVGTRSDFGYMGNGDAYRVECSSCCSHGSMLGSRADAIAAWNRRTSPSASAPGRWVALMNEAARAIESLLRESKRGHLWMQEARALHDRASRGSPPTYADKTTMEATINRLADTLRYDNDDLPERLRAAAPPEANDTNPQAQGGAGT